jgi:predicted RNase H-like nuclease
VTLKIFERRGWVKVVDRRLVDDVLDAIAAAWTADRIARGEAEVITDPAQTEIALYV